MPPALVETMTEPPVAGLGRAALRAIFEQHKDEVFGFLAKLLRDRHQAEDVLQETFVRVAANLGRFDAGRAVRPWLFEIARNAALDALRRRKKRDEVEPLQEEPATGEGLLPEMERAERIEAARRALAALPAETRALLL